ncbi:MAG: hypothetical protein CMP48_20255 [Rickettsiales bacterium]|nr:hypothetical protein [Rickettsiales bacterium]
MVYRKTALLLLLTGSLFSAYSQEELIKRFEIQSNQRIAVSGKATAVVFRTNIFQGNSIDLSINGKTETIPFDADGPEFTYYKSLDGATQITSFSSDYAGSLHLINSGPVPTIEHNTRIAQQDECDFTINPILQSDWRAGLPEPTYSRSFTNVEHVIVHHSAGSNSATNYTQVVRDIYVYHTESNGWSDIGYNYLIAQNGDLYAGRDPAGGEQDNVLGAHFCGSNSTTMGICLLGNYETASVTSATWQTLQELASFKIAKEDLDPTTFSSHPLGSIGHIAGHRDGCSTACPGENVYNMLGDLRLEVQDLVNYCGRKLEIGATDLVIDAGRSVGFSNLSFGYDSYVWRLEGAQPSYAQWRDGGNALYIYGGVFDVQLIGLVDGVEEDTITYSDFVQVNDALSIFPNPIKPLHQLTLATSKSVNEVIIHGLDGKTYYQNKDIQNREFQVPPLKQGLYILKIYTSEGLEKQRLLIN